MICMLSDFITILLEILFGFCQTYSYNLYTNFGFKDNKDKRYIMKKNKFTRILIISAIIISILLSSIIYIVFFSSSTVTAQPRAVDTYATNESVENLSYLINDFSFKLYNQIALENTDNIFFSPYSIFVALAMTYEGARNETADEMHNALGFPQNDTVTLCSFGRIYNLLNINKEYTLNTANALWIKKEYPFLEEYLTFIENYYMGKTTEVDFSNPEKAADLINRWIEKNTGGKIKNLITKEDIHEYLAMILTNAIYFKGDWLNKFDKDLTTNRDFELSNGEITSVPMMALYKSDLKFNYTETNDLQMLELPYKGDKLSMLVLLPKENNISIVEKMLNRENLSKWIKSMNKTNVEVILPKFKLETEYSLKNYLANMGMINPFTVNADFSGITGKKDLFIEKVKHKAFIEVNEEGTEAAAATSVHMALTAIPEYTVFNADHPFIFLIMHKETGNILFMGRLSKPS